MRFSLLSVLLWEETIRYTGREVRLHWDDDIRRTKLSFHREYEVSVVSKELALQNKVNFRAVWLMWTVICTSDPHESVWDAERQPTYAGQEQPAKLLRSPSAFIHRGSRIPGRWGRQTDVWVEKLTGPATIFSRGTRGRRTPELPQMTALFSPVHSHKNKRS